MKRREAREAAQALERENQYLGGMTLGRICGAGVVRLHVACQNCPRRGRYRVTRLIDRHGAAMSLVDLKRILAGECPNMRPWYNHDPCAVCYPGLSRHEVTPL